MIPISNEDARVILQLLERGHQFYRNHAVKMCHVNDGRRMAVMTKKLRKKMSKYCEPHARSNKKSEQQ